MFLVLASVIIIPFTLGFSVEATGGLYYFNTLTDIFFGLDMLVNFRTPFFDHSSGELVVDPGAIRRRYLGGWFAIDFFSTVPLDEAVGLFISNSDSNLRTIKLIKGLRLIRLLKMARLLKLKRFAKNIQAFIPITPAGQRQLKLLFEVTFIAHLLACFWYFVGEQQVESTGTSWFLRSGIRPADADIDGDGEPYDSLTDLYIAGLYWAFTTMTTVGYGDIIATSNEERIYAIFSMLLGASVFGYIVGSMAAVVGRGDAGSARVKLLLNSLAEYLAEGKLHHSHMERLERHYDYFYQCRSAFDEKNLLDLMSGELRKDCVIFLNKDVAKSIGFMRELFYDDASFSVALVSQMQPVYILPGELVYRQVCLLFPYRY
jgi:hypothetical protein